MIVPLAGLLERYFKLPTEQTIPFLKRLWAVLGALLFLVVATIIIAFETVFPGQSNVATLQVGDIAPTNIYAPETRQYVSQVLTSERQQEAVAAVRPVYDPIDLNIARTQSELANRIIEYVDNVRYDTLATDDQRNRDLRQITALQLNDSVIRQILQMEEETWQAVASEVLRLLEQVMRETIYENDLPTVRQQLPQQVSLQFDEQQAGVIVALVGDLIRVNTFENAQETERRRQEAAAGVQEVLRSYQRGEIIVREGNPIGENEYEALEQLGLLQPTDRRLQEIARAVTAVVLLMGLSFLYIRRFCPPLLGDEAQFLGLLAAIFLIVLTGARVSLNGDFYHIYPSAVLALLYVAVMGPQVAFIGTLGLGFMVGLMIGNSLENTMLTVAGGLIGTLVLGRSERLNSYFVAGLLVALVNIIIVIIFHITEPFGTIPVDLPVLLLYSLLNGVLTAAAAVVGLYLITFFFNLPTALKLIELSQPNQPLLQRLLREAPGTYQHSLQVANLSEQAANAIGANAELVHVAALYHDIGKMLNPAFFTENQRDIGNPHDALNDPYRSADIIISHVTDGDEMAKQYHLPERIGDFIREHHGTSQVYVFYRLAVALAGDDESEVDIDDFTYPGPRPQSRETAILMLSDSCEAAVRSIQPNSRQEIEETVQKIIEGKRQSGQLDDSGLTLNDLNAIKRIFVDMLQATFHPRINYAEAVNRARGSGDDLQHAVDLPPLTEQDKAAAAGDDVAAPRIHRTQTMEIPTFTDDDDDDAPMTDIPPLPRANGRQGQADPEAAQKDDDDVRN